MKDCRRIRKAVSQALPVPAELEEHLFACPACRRFVRAEQILDLMHEFRQAPGSSSPEFVERVMNSLGGKSRARTQNLWSGGHAMGRRTGVFCGCRLWFFGWGEWHKEHRVGCVRRGFTDSDRFNRNLRITIPLAAVMRAASDPVVPWGLLRSYLRRCRRSLVCGD